MKRNTSFFLVAGIGAFLLMPFITKTFRPTPPETILDTALSMLKDFIILGNDSSLGFRNFDELQNATIRQDEAIDEYYLREDTLLSSNKKFEEELIPIGRKIYPVYAGNELRSAITFDSTPSGWKPVIFENAEEIDEYIADRHLPGNSSESGLSYEYILMPFIHSDIILRTGTNGAQILRTHELESEVAEDLPSPLGASPSKIDERAFVDGLKRHMLKMHGM